MAPQAKDVVAPVVKNWGSSEGGFAFQKAVNVPPRVAGPAEGCPLPAAGDAGRLVLPQPAATPAAPA